MIEILLVLLLLAVCWVAWILRTINHNIFARNIRAKIEHQEILTNHNIMNRRLVDIKHLLTSPKDLDVIIRENTEAFDREIRHAGDILRDKSR